MGRIARLPDSLVNQIAAGEVVERPASIIKELCENSLDAGAKTIRVELAVGGLQRICVLDDGCGMSPDDARLSLERHATSKLQSAEGLSRIATLGFRGEALPSIASVSRFTLTTREPQALAATRLVLEGGKLTADEEVGAPAGTQVVVEDLFFNTPARRKFSKRPETELSHGSEAIARLALANRGVAFHLSHHGRVSFTSAAGDDLRDRISQAVSAEAAKSLIAVDLQRGEVRISGFLTAPDFSLSTNRGLYLFVNGRFIRDRGLMHAIVRGYANVLPQGRQPAAVLFIEVPLESVDVNVHPQKLEVRFVDSRGVYEATVEAVRDALRTSPWLPTANGAPGIDGRRTGAWPSSGMAMAAEAVDRFRDRSGFSLPPPMPQGSWIDAGLRPTWDPGRELAYAPLDGEGRAPGYFGTLRYIGQLSRTYLVCEAPGGSLVLIDQHAAHERLRFDALQKQHKAGPLVGQPFLFPVQLTLPAADAQALLGHPQQVAALGIELEAFGGESIALKSLPAILAGCDYARLLTDVAQELGQLSESRSVDDAMSHVLATMACHSAVRANQTLAPEEAVALLRGLDGIEFSTRCPHGRPVAAELTLAELERRVHRR